MQFAIYPVYVDFGKCFICIWKDCILCNCYLPCSLSGIRSGLLIVFISSGFLVYPNPSVTKRLSGLKISHYACVFVWLSFLFCQFHFICFAATVSTYKSGILYLTDNTNLLTFWNVLFSSGNAFCLEVKLCLNITRLFPLVSICMVQLCLILLFLTFLYLSV